ncbi:ABC transporter [Candidatus Roizmanbacteria bacterium RIFCSPHIGHO2_12_FULL_41_11]|uniref:ABC transporter n=3 Tax=Candidatus Roizmaniibacteriota TaxID=1752723 RepID=A0A1F7JR13_9BACT|nr:MAG: ABC transporter [Candidatus Roizmanbacteria bacterium RIFCSPHIGHO2_12_FULL_41_11]OGK51181.1 MAG: ABC transporter [Candidatus Roizmanbacteria bacterium RIFCSPLOWO2_01_FULL_41_22]OGK58021.1 MAG: ABC transporter [Candidatus Roizmanbacteria bacterium RIFCSPLOWO2_02_FULL_41_9]
MPIISVQNLRKTFQVPYKEPGVAGALKSLIHRKYLEKPAVDGVSFTIEEGELVGFIGPNGAGKTTTLKCLSGLLFPTSGEIDVLGFRPFDRKKTFLQQISLVMGQKNQLWWDLPAMETFLLNKEIYQITEKQFQRVLQSLVEILQVADVVQIPVRNLSLGQRMKCELIAALIHQPKVIFLDEPTIGLDVVMQQNLRTFIKEYNHQFNATLILTSHYMEDVKELCERVIVINNGKIVFDGRLDDIVKKFSTDKKITLLLSKSVDLNILQSYGQIKSSEGNKVTIMVPSANSRQIAAELLAKLPVVDVNIEEPEIEEIIRQMFTRK